MVKVEAMPADEIDALLRRQTFGHLGCSYDDHPYVVPMHYAYDGQDLYFLTTEGTKTGFIAANPEVCFQVEEVIDASNWRSVMIVGRATKLTKSDELERAMQLIAERNPTLAPALNRTDIGPWHRLSRIVVYRLRPATICGRRTV